MNKTLLTFILALSFIFCSFSEITAVTSFNSVSVSKETQKPKRKKRRGLIIHRNSGTIPTAICRDGMTSLSRHSRGTCSHHGGVLRWIR